jgi:hypothetical protein
METTTKTSTTPVKAASKLLSEATVYELLRRLEELTYSLPEAAKKAGEDPRTMRAFCREQKIAGAYKLFDDAWMLTAKDFDAWLLARSTKVQEERKLKAQLEELQAKMDELRQSKSAGSKS